MNKEKIAFCGTRGVPSNYGGFETAVDEISRRFVRQGYSVDIFCRVSHYGEVREEHQGRRLIQVKGTSKRSLETFVSAIQTGWYLLRHSNEYNHVFWFNNANFPGIIFTLFTGIPFTVNTDGFEWKRKKWRWPFKLYYLLTSFLVSKICPSLISDSKVIQKFYKEKFRKQTIYVPYGFPTRVEVSRQEQDKILQTYGLSEGRFFLQITRIEPDNLPLEAAQAFIRSNLYKQGFSFIIVGYSQETSYASELKELSGIAGVKLISANYDQNVLYTLRNNCHSYIHGNSVGGTNPALLEAMAICPRILAIDSEFSKELLGDCGVLFHPQNIEKGIENLLTLDNIHDQLSARVTNNYNWDAVGQAYIEIVEGTFTRYNPLVAYS